MGKFFQVILILIFVIAVLMTLGGTIFGDFLHPRSGLFISLDKGANWKSFGEIVSGGNLNRLDVVKIKFHPKDPRIVYLGTLGNSLLKSIDSGAHWIQLGGKDKALSPRANVYSIATDYNLPDYLKKIPDRFYLAAYQDNFGRILKTEDGGNSFKEVYITSRPNYAIFPIELDPQRSNIVWAGTAEGLLLKSQDYGETWKLAQEFPGVINAIIIKPDNPRQMFVSTFSNGIFTSADGGASWTEETEGLNDFPQATNIENAVYDPLSGTIYLATSFGVLKSTNGGVDWQAVNVVFADEVLPVLDIAISPKNSREIYIVGGQHVYRTINGGASWQVRKLLTNKRARAAAVDPSNISRILVGSGKYSRH